MQVEELEDFKEILEYYKQYKYGNSSDKRYGERVPGIFNIQNIIYRKKIYFPGFKRGFFVQDTTVYN